MSFLYYTLWFNKDKKKQNDKINEEDNSSNEKLLNNNEEDARFYYLSLFKKSNNKWSIHGLWPQYDKQNYPVYCKKVKFDFSNLKPIINKLETEWYSYDGKSLKEDETFWKHEWEKHGSCVFTPIDEFTYFNTALNLYHFAISKGLPNKYYNKEHKTCLIPVDLNFQFIDK